MPGELRNRLIPLIITLAAFLSLLASCTHSLNTEGKEQLNEAKQELKLLREDLEALKGHMVELKDGLKSVDELANQLERTNDFLTGPDGKKWTATLEELGRWLAESNGRFYGPDEE